MKTAVILLGLLIAYGIVGRIDADAEEVTAYMVRETLLEEIHASR